MATTIGVTSTPTTLTGANTQNVITAQRATVPAGGGTIAVARAYLIGTNSGTAGETQQFRMAVYTETSSVPDVPLGSSNIVAVAYNAAAGWVDFTFASPVAVSAGNIWLTLHPNVITAKVYTGYTSTGVGRFATKSFASGSPNPMGAMSAANVTYGFQADVEVTATTGAPQAIPLLLS